MSVSLAISYWTDEIPWRKTCPPLIQMLSIERGLEVRVEVVFSIQCVDFHFILLFLIWCLSSCQCFLSSCPKTSVVSFPDYKFQLCAQVVEKTWGSICFSKRQLFSYSQLFLHCSFQWYLVPQFLAQVLANSVVHLFSASYFPLPFGFML